MPTFILSVGVVAFTSFVIHNIPGADRHVTVREYLQSAALVAGIVALVLAAGYLVRRYRRSREASSLAPWLILRCLGAPSKALGGRWLVPLDRGLQRLRTAPRRRG